MLLNSHGGNARTVQAQLRVHSVRLDIQLSKQQGEALQLCVHTCYFGEKAWQATLLPRKLRMSRSTHTLRHLASTTLTQGERHAC